MSWQKRSIQLILGFPLAMPIVTYAVNVGDTYVQSGQNQPLNATINVTDVDPKTFSVSIANPEMYKQLGLSADQQVKAKFVPTSNNGGKIILTTKAPVNAPFTDVVLNINNKGEKNLLPKTLLMPLDEKSPSTQKPSKTVEIPEESVVVTHHAPIDLPKTTQPTVIDVPAEPPVTVSPPSVTAKSSVKLPSTKTPATVSITKSTTKEGSYSTDGSLGRPDLSGSSSSTTDDSTAQTKPAETLPESTDNKKPSIAKQTATTTEETTETPKATTTYVVQRNDNLWTIANRIAVKNKTNPKKVMQDIMDANPSVFENGDATRIDANTSLKIPKYKVVPSSAGVKAAKTIRKQTKASHHKAAASQKSAVSHRARPKATSRRALRRVKYHATTYPARSTHKSEMTIVAPSQSSGSSQGSTQIQNNSVSRNATPQLIDQVKLKRQNTAGQASKVNQLNSSLESSAQRLKLQNEKLAMLEKRLKELNGK